VVVDQRNRAGVQLQIMELTASRLRTWAIFSLHVACLFGNFITSRYLSLLEETLLYAWSFLSAI